MRNPTQFYGAHWPAKEYAFLLRRIKDRFTTLDDIGRFNGRAPYNLSFAKQ
ncbi:MAG: hypothetical protein JWL62_9 [Hyphomicrobiales bacterium]|nr:hypothetical protein [Hyphomicrobiales bacterium]